MNPNQNQPDTKNFLAAVIISLAILFGFQMFWIEPQEKAMRAKQAEIAKTTATATANAGNIPNAASASLNSATRPQALALSSRIQVEGPQVKGSISTLGARLDDLDLLKYRQSVAANSPNVTLLNPQGSKDGYYAFFGWTSPNANTAALPGPNTIWKLVSGEKLTPTTPITLEYDNGQGLKFTRKIEMDREYLFTYTDSITNTSAAPLELQAYGAVRRHSQPAISNGANHEGTVGILDNKLERLKYREMLKGKSFSGASLGGWLGITDHYWMVALIPQQNENITANYKAVPENTSHMFEASFIGPITNIGAGQTISHQERLYAGSKEVNELRSYEQRLNIPKFDNGIDWGVLWFLSKPFYWLLLFFTSKIGNIGLAILGITIVVKVVTFPLVYQSYKSFAKLRDLNPKMKALQEKFADDKQKQQQELIKLYQTEKINPVAGCVPMLLTMPIFLALFKVLSISLELRHAPFYGWIQDLSAKDPTSLFNLFGLLPFDPTAIPVIGGFFAVGAWPLLYGVSMWLLQKMQPATVSDPIQARVFAIMPWMFAYIFASFSSGLVIYYTWSNLLTIVQQYIISKRVGSSNPIDEFFAKLGHPKENAK